ncbi:alpha/beta hydrolase [soil metagenome]
MGEVSPLDDLKLPTRARGWAAGGRLVSLLGRRVFVREGGGDGKPPLLLLHGFPSSSFDWSGIAGQLGGRRWIALDFLGFGLSEKPAELNDLFLQADLVEAALAELSVPAVEVVAHDMGTTVANELMARAIEGRLGFSCEVVVLFNGSMVIERASLTWEQRMLRSRAGFVLAAASNKLSLKRGLGGVFGEAHPMEAEELDCQWALLSRDGGSRKLHKAIAYIDQRFEFADRWHGAIANWPGRLELVWGMEDPVATTAVLDAVRELRTAARVTELPGLGHYPQIEDPARTAAAVLAALD